MSIDNQSKINDYIKKFKGTKNLFKSYNEFDLEWLNSFDEKKLDYEMIFGNGHYNDMVLEDLKNDIY